MRHGDVMHTVRFRTNGDMPTLANLLREVHALDGYPVEGVDDTDQWLIAPSGSLAWVCVLDGVVIGHVMLFPVPSESASSLSDVGVQIAPGTLMLARLFVAPDARGMGVGRRLVEECMDVARSRAAPLVLDVMAKDQAAIRLYEKAGWTLIGQTLHSYGANMTTECLWYVAPSS